MVFIYGSGTFGAKAESIARRNGWQCWTCNDHRLAFDDATFASALPLGAFVPATSGRREIAWLITAGSPRAPSSTSTSDGLPQSSPLAPVEFARLLHRSNISELSSLRGVFAGTLIIPDAQFVVVCRDRLGGATAYYKEDGGSFAVASNAYLLALASNSISEDPVTIGRHFRLKGSHPPGRTAFGAVSELLPGEVILRRGNRTSVLRKKWPLGTTSHAIPASQVTDLIRERLECAVARILPENSDSGIMLSGGMDSGPTASIAARLLQSRATQLHAVSWSLDDFPEADEWTWIEALANHLGIPIHRVAGSGMLPFSLLDTSAVQTDWPDFNPFRSLVNACYRIARDQGLTTLINANAGDRLYPQSRFTLLDQLLRGQYIRATRRSLSLTPASNPLRALRNAEIRTVLAFWKNRYWSKRVKETWPWLVDAQASADHSGFQWPEESQSHHIPSYAEQVLGMGLSGSLAHENWFAEQFEVSRVDPFYDPDLAALFLQIPFELHFDGAHAKATMRRAMLGHLPEAYRTKSRTGLLNTFFHSGFDANIRQIRDLLETVDCWKDWVRTEPVHAVLAGEDRSSRGRLIVSACIGYALWKERTRSLYAT